MTDDKNTLTKDKICDFFHEKLGYSTKEAKEHLEMLLEEIKNSLEAKKPVKVSGFGKWSVKEKKSRPGRNPHTGGRIEITSRHVVTFHPSDKLRTAINSNEEKDWI
tara:strand:- start:236 stop:553 length:318 start_codon:yes stop_codon:yes gene_type:complete